MKKKIINVSLALLLILSVCLSVSVSASAKSDKTPKDNQPVAWVNFTAAGASNRSNPSDPGHSLPQVQILAMKLADGSTIGHARIRFLKLDMECTYEVVDSRFSLDGDTKIADILMIDSDGMYWCYHLEDSGKGNERMGAFVTYYYWNWPYIAPPFPIDPLPTEMIDFTNLPTQIAWYIIFEYQWNPWVRIHITDTNQE